MVFRTSKDIGGLKIENRSFSSEKAYNGGKGRREFGRNLGGKKVGMSMPVASQTERGSFNNFRLRTNFFFRTRTNMICRRRKLVEGKLQTRTKSKDHIGTK